LRSVPGLNHHFLGGDPSNGTSNKFPNREDLTPDFSPTSLLPIIIADAHRLMPEAFPAVTTPSNKGRKLP